MSEPADVVIIGGGLIGSSIAFHLLEAGFDGTVRVVERDPSYRFASSALALGGVRHQFASRVSFEMVRYSADLFESVAEIGFRRLGYLFLVDADSADLFRRRFEAMRGIGVSVEWIDTAGVRRLVPDLNTDDIVAGVFGPKDGYLEPRRALEALRGRAERAGAEFVSDEVRRIEVVGGRVRAVTCRSGVSPTRQVVIACGAFSAPIAATAGIDLPVTPVRQQLFRCTLPRRWEYDFPMVVDPSGLHWRGETPTTIVAARTRHDEPPGERFECDTGRFDEEFLPILGRRLPAFRDLRLESGWGGLYEMTPDHNAILGGCDEIEGLYWATGFSGHGLMMAPAAGLLMSEFIRTGRFASIDASQLCLERFARGELLHDEAMI